MNKHITNTYLVSLLVSLAFVCSFLSATEPRPKTLIMVSAGWCQPCHVAKHDMENDKVLSDLVKKYEIIDVDYDLDKDIVEGYNIKTVPTFIIMHQGKELGRKTGYTKKELVNFLNK